MVYNVYGHQWSTCTARVIVSFLAMGLDPDKDFKFISSDWEKIKTPEWLAHSPFGQMPYLEDTEAGLEVYESRAIVAYVAAKTKSPLAPGTDDLVAFAKYQQAAQAEATQFDAPASILAEELLFGKWFGHKTDEDVVAHQKKIMGVKLEGYERILSNHKYLGGDEVTVADLMHLPYGCVVQDAGGLPNLTDGSLPNVARWWKEILVHPAWTKTKAMGINVYDDV